MFQFSALILFLGSATSSLLARPRTAIMIKAMTLFRLGNAYYMTCRQMRCLKSDGSTNELERTESVSDTIDNEPSP